MTDPNLFDLPALPYAGTSGHNSTDTSIERANRMDTGIQTKQIQWATIEILSERGPQGITFIELSELLNIHAGSSAGALSTMHTAGLIERLEAKRGRSHIYVAMEHVDGRPTKPKPVKKCCKHCGGEL